MTTAVAVSAPDVTRRALIACLNSRRAPAAPTELDGVDWEALWEMASAERVAPLLYHAARRSDLLPSWLIDRCRSEYVETGAHNTLRMRELAGVIAKLSDHQIDLIVLKGAALAGQVYGNLGLRPMLDIDLLIRRDDVRSAQSVLESLGYERQGREITPGSTLAFENEIGFSKRDRLDWSLELHWSLFDSPYYQRRLSVDALWATAQPIRIEGVPAYSLSPELLVLYLCGHLMLHHQGSGLLWWNDIAECIQCFGDRLDWDELLVQAEALHLVKPLQAVLPVAAGVWLAPVPSDVLSRLDTIIPDPGEVQAFDAMTAGRRPPAWRLIDDLREMAGWGERLRFVYHNLFPSADYMDERYGIGNPVMRVVYYPYRWMLGMWEVLRPDFKNPNKPENTVNSQEYQL